MARCRLDHRGRTDGVLSTALRRENGRQRVGHASVHPDVALNDQPQPLLIIECQSAVQLDTGHMPQRGIRSTFDAEQLRFGHPEGAAVQQPVPLADTVLAGLPVTDHSHQIDELWEMPAFSIRRGVLQRLGHGAHGSHPRLAFGTQPCADTELVR
jgi:hypothetical protein